MSNARNLANLLGTSSTLPASKAPDGTRILIHSYSLGVDTANVSFDNTHITDTYDDYILEAKHFTPTTDSDEMIVQCSSDNGSNYATSGHARHYLRLAANAASGGIKEERDRRQVVQGHLAKEAAAAEAAAHQQQIDNLIKYREAGGKRGKFKPTQQSTLEISTSAGNRLPGFDVENDVQLTDFRNKINIISNALHDNPDFSDRSLYETGTKASELVSLAWDPKTKAFDVDILNKITLAAQHARDGVVDESGRIPPLEVIEQRVGYAQQQHPDDPDKQTAFFFGLMGQPLKRLDVDIHGPAPALQPEVTEEESSVTEEISDRDALEAERERKIREHQEWMNNRP